MYIIYSAIAHHEFPSIKDGDSQKFHRCNSWSFALEIRIVAGFRKSHLPLAKAPEIDVGCSDVSGEPPLLVPRSTRVLIMRNATRSCAAVTDVSVNGGAAVNGVAATIFAVKGAAVNGATAQGVGVKGAAVNKVGSPGCESATCSAEAAAVASPTPLLIESELSSSFGGSPSTDSAVLEPDMLWAGGFCSQAKEAAEAAPRAGAALEVWSASEAGFSSIEAPLGRSWV